MAEKKLQEGGRGKRAVLLTLVRRESNSVGFLRGAKEDKKKKGSP